MGCSCMGVHVQADTLVADMLMWLWGLPMILMSHGYSKTRPHLMYWYSKTVAVLTGLCFLKISEIFAMNLCCRQDVRHKWNMNHQSTLHLWHDVKSVKVVTENSWELCIPSDDSQGSDYPTRSLFLCSLEVNILKDFVVIYFDFSWARMWVSE